MIPLNGAKQHSDTRSELLSFVLELHLVAITELSSIHVNLITIDTTIL